MNPPLNTEASLVIAAEQIQTRVADLGRQITTDYKDKSLLVLGVLNGAFIFTADLCRAISLDMEIDFVRVASYGSSTSSSGEICLRKAPEREIEGKHILLVEDIVDTGHTLAWLRNYFADQGAESVKICALIDKAERRTVEVQVDYPGFNIDQGFLVGYGLDFAEKYRNLPAVYALHM